MSPETPSPHRYPPWLLVAVAASLLVLYGLLWGLPNLWDPAADSLTPQGLLVAQSRDFLRLTSGRYPPLHFYALRLAFVPADALAHLGAFANLKLKSTLYITTARLISAAMFVATVLLVRALTRRLYGPGPGLIAAAVVALCPLAQYYAKNANLDVPYVFWLALALLFLQRFFDEQRSWDLTWAALCATAAVCTKDQAYGFVLLLPVPVLASLRHRLGAWRPVLTSFTVWRAACAAVLGFALCHGLMWNPQPFVEHVRVIAGPASQGWRETTPDLIGQVRLLTETILRLAEAMSEPIFAAAVAGAVLAARQRRGLWLLWGPVGYWLAFLAVAGYVYPRFTLPMVVACAPLAGLALDRLRRWRPAAKPVGAILAGLALAWLAVACAALLYDLDNDTRASAQAWIEEHVPITAKVGFLGPERDMPRLNRAELDARRAAFRNSRVIDLVRTEEQPGAPAVAFAPDVLIVSLEKTYPLALARARAPAAWLLATIGDWGRLAPFVPRNSDLDRLLTGQAGYRVAARFAPPLAPLAPEVSPSCERVIAVLLKSAPAHVR